MIIQCEKCGSTFNLDGSMVKEEGSKVRCSLCKHVFVVYPKEEEPIVEHEIGIVSEPEFEETVTLDSPAEEDEAPEENEIESDEDELDKALEGSLEDEGTVQSLSPEELHELDEEEKEDQKEDESVPPAQTTDEKKEEKEEEQAEKEEEVDKTVPKKKRKGKSRLPIIVLLIIIILLGAGIAVFFFAPELLPGPLSELRQEPKKNVTDIGVRRLSFKAVTGSFVDSKKVGQLFVIEGKVLNNYSKSRSFILVKGTILNDNGQVIRQKSAYAGNTFDEKKLANLTIEQINKALKNRQGLNMKNVDVAPGTLIPFVIVFEKLPDDLGEFTVEAVSSSPGN